MKIPFVTKWIETRRQKQVEAEFWDSVERDRIAREAEIDVEQERFETERWAESERKDAAHQAAFGHPLFDDDPDKCQLCIQAREREQQLKEDQEHLDQFGHVFSGNTFCAICAEDEEDPLAGEVDPVGGWDEREYMDLASMEAPDEPDEFAA